MLLFRNDAILAMHNKTNNGLNHFYREDIPKRAHSKKGTFSKAPLKNVLNKSFCLCYSVSPWCFQDCEAKAVRRRYEAINMRMIAK